MSTGHSGPSIWTPILAVIAVIIVMFAIWYYTGGPERTDTTQPFQKPLPPLDTGETYGPGTPVQPAGQ